ncbi:hypothetical protein HOG21_01200 [bacterium]|nr:hypothetical protein [bacterium]
MSKAPEIIITKNRDYTSSWQISTFLDNSTYETYFDTGASHSPYWNHTVNSSTIKYQKSNSRYANYS